MIHMIKYSVLRYSPSVVAGEAINLGLLVSDAQAKRIEFHYTKKWDRIKAFDDTLHIDGLKTALQDMKNDVEVPLYHSSRGFSIDNYIRGFTNELHFSSPYQLECESMDTQINELRKIYLRFDFDQKDRLTKAKELHFVRSLLSVNGIPYRSQVRTVGDFDVPVNYDLTFGNYGVHYIRFENKNIAKMMNGIKAWAWDSEHDHSTSTVFIYSPDGTEPNNKAKLEKSLAILRDASDNVFSIDDPQIGDTLLGLFNSKRERSLLTDAQ